MYEDSSLDLEPCISLTDAFDFVSGTKESRKIGGEAKKRKLELLIIKHRSSLSKQRNALVATMRIM